MNPSEIFNLKNTNVVVLSTKLINMPIEPVSITSTNFDIKNVNFSVPEKNKNGYKVSYVTYRDPDTGAKGPLEVALQGRWRLVFKPSEYEGRWTMQLDSQRPEERDAEHSAFYNLVTAIDNMCREEVRKNPGKWVGKNKVSEEYLSDNQNSCIAPSTTKDENGVKVPDGKYADSYKLKFPMRRDGSHICEFYMKRAGKKALEPITVEDLEANMHCSVVIQCNNAWTPQGRYGVSWKVMLVKAYENASKSRLSLLADPDESSDEEYESDDDEEVEDPTAVLSDPMAEDDDEELVPLDE